MQSEPAFHVRQSRPHQLSDPGFDFWPEELKRLLAVCDQELTWADFQSLPGPYLPAGTYDEVIYDLPLALKHLRDHTKDAGDMMDAVVGFCSRNDTIRMVGY
jgi:hypothetical protein